MTLQASWSSSTEPGRASMTSPLAARVAERERLIALARAYAQRLCRRVPVTAVVVAGSVARGDFNVWSDVDVVVVAEALPERAVDRAALLLSDAPGGVQPIGYTPPELAEARRRGDRLVCSALSDGIVVFGSDRALSGSP
jgi:UTP:GlnB (protein PII) uridylyltransferase